MDLAQIEHHAASLQSLVIYHAPLIAAAILSIWMLSEIVLRFVRHNDKRTRFLATFFDIDVKNIIPLPPGNALWRDYARLNRDANAMTQIPPGGPSLQGSYLLHAHGGMTVVAVHNFDLIDLYPDPEEPELRDYITPSISSDGRIVTHRLPADIEHDVTLRANFVEFLLQAKFGYPGRVRPALLLRDKDDIAPPPEGSMTQSGSTITRLSIDEPKKSARALDPLDEPVEASNLHKIAVWFTSYAGRQTSRIKLIRRVATLGFCLMIIAMKYSDITGVTFEDFAGLF